MSSADENGKSDKGSDENIDETVVDLDEERTVDDTTAGESTGSGDADGGDAESGDADGVADAGGDDASTNAERRAARQAKKDASAKNVQLTIPVRALKQFGLAILAIAAVVAISLSVFQVVQKDKQLDAFADSKTAAAHFVETLLESMNAPNANADSMRKAVGPLSTGDFKKRLSSDATVNTDFFKDNKIDKIKVTITSSMVESFDADRATVVLAGEVSGVSAASGSPGRQAILLQVEMNKVDDDWLASDVSAGPGITVGAQQEGQPPVPGVPAPEAPAQPTP
ncbi:hypothetical protein [Gordonia phthalatica]|uniref:Mce-associated membrane protein n=1 Tax=Gordonia phthalatica TaxID=1136941 RepID=A0A0N9NBZ8_9ACTN|nr:hypothetical protein [Gordonia phthalatica]ALG85122.1 hypothetical protein ACH46_12335 [Gordonia phthalatica]